MIVRNVWRSKLASSASSSTTRCIASFQRCSSVAGDQPIGGIDRLVAPLRQIGLVACPLDPPPPLCADGLIALLEAGQRLESKLDRQRRDGGDQTFGNAASSGLAGTVMQVCRVNASRCCQLHWYVG